MEFSISTIVTIVIGSAGGVGALLVHATYFGSRYGRMDRRIEDVEADVKGVRFDLDEQGKKIDKVVEESFRHFVTQDSCNHINTTWKTEVKSLMAQRDLWNKHNEEAHGRTTKMLDRILSTLDKNKESNDKALDDLSDCIHKIQNDMKC